MIETIELTPYLKNLLQKNDEFSNSYKSNSLMKLIESKKMEKKENRQRLLDCLQTFSDYFQKIVMLRYVLCDDKDFLPIIQLHLKEEFGHNILLMNDRKNRPPIWDPILDASSAWFAWKMLSLNQEEKSVLMHMVLESSANLFFKKAHVIMRKYKETNYFETHAVVDEEHEKMGIDLLRNINESQFIKLLDVQKKGWEMLNTTCERICFLTNLT